MSDEKLRGVIESILFIAERPVKVSEIADSCGVMVAQVQTQALKLIEEYSSRGVRIVRKGDYLQMATSGENTAEVARFFRRELRANLSEAALETLAIVVHQQPITKAQIDQIRGVNSDTSLRLLLVRGLITEVGRKQSLGRPILYGTTMEFMQYFGFEKPEDVPKVLAEVTLFE
ncbi:MAG: SMC-Scp complex subunit ScpB [bacterium]